MAVRWFESLIAERRVDLQDIEWVVARLQDAREGLATQAGEALERLLTGRPAGERHGFDGWSCVYPEVI